MEFSKQQNVISLPRYGSIKLKTLCAGYAFAVTVAACLAGSVESSALMLVITAMFAPLILMPETLVGPIFFCSMFDEFLLAGDGSSVSRFLVLFFIAGAAITILQKGTIKQISLYFMLLIVMGVLLSFYTTQGYTSIPTSYILNILLLITMINYTAFSFENIPKRIYSYAILALAFVYMLFVKNGFDSLVDGGRMSISEAVNSNELAMGLAVVMAILVSDMLQHKKHMLLNLLFIGANLIALFFTGSRTALIAAIVATFLLYLIHAKDKRSKRNAFFLLILSIALLVFIYNTLQKEYPVLMERFTAENVEESGGTGRVDVWKHYFIYFFPQHWIIGMGFDPQNLYYGLVSLNLEAHGAHNFIIDILARSGVVGLILYAVCIVKFFVAVAKKLRANSSLLVPMAIVITTLLNGIGENVLAGRFLWFGIGLGYMFIYSMNQENEKEAGGNYDTGYAR